MKVIQARNVHEALPKGLALLQHHNVPRASRNGPVRVAPGPVTTVYARPLERVCFWPQRDANPFFHLYESLWMLAGRHDLAPLLRYVKDFGQFSDDGQILHGAYGFRWRHSLGEDQLVTIADRLKANPEDRRCVLQMWQGEYDLGRDGKDVPCNTMATFQRGPSGALDLTVFCRSNDIIWGAYGANAVHFGFLLEYMATCIGCPVGTYTQVSVNWHAYESTLRTVAGLGEEARSGIFSTPAVIDDPYTKGHVVAVPLLLTPPASDVGPHLLREIERLLYAVDLSATGYETGEPFFQMAFAVLRAHEQWRTLAPPERFEAAQVTLAAADQQADWVVAAQQWLARRHAAWEAKLTRQVPA